MEFLKSVLFLAALLVSCSASGGRSQKVFKINIDERGTQYNETVEINDKENSVIYKVPEHNNVAQSETRFDYKTGYFATRIPELKECYIQRIPEGQSSSRFVRKYLQQYRIFKKSKSTVPVKTIATAVIKEQRIDLRELSSSLSAFCGGFVAYKGRQVYHRNFFQMQQNQNNGKGVGRNIRSTSPIIWPQSIDVYVGGPERWKKITLNTCKKLLKYYPELEKGGCANNPDNWENSCHVKTRTCIYTVKCKLVVAPDRSTAGHYCEETHFYTGWTCCDVKCSN